MDIMDIHVDVYPIYIHIHIYICVCIYLYMHMYTHIVVVADGASAYLSCKPVCCDAQEFSTSWSQKHFKAMPHQDGPTTQVHDPVR